MARKYQVDLSSLKIIAAQMQQGTRPPNGEGYELVVSTAIVERLEALVEVLETIDETLKWIGRDKIGDLKETVYHWKSP